MPTTIVDPAFEGVGKEAGLEIWRIEKLKVVAQDKKTYGKFYSGDSYIVLHTYLVKGKFYWNIHFWLGKSCTQDEAGIAAYKTVELDDHLGGSPVQYREVQLHESKAFLSLFPKGIQYLEGGIDSGFKKVDRNAFTKRLLHIKGKRNIRVQQVELSYTSLNHGDVFLLDAGRQIFCWNGKESSKRERIKGTEVARTIRDEERGGKAKIVVIDASIDSERKFFEILGSKGTIASADEGGDDSDFEKKKQNEITLYRVSDESGALVIEVAAKPPLKRQHLDSNDCFILDSGASGVFSWIGKGCTKQEKSAAMTNAVDFVRTKGYPEWTQVTRIVEAGEPPIFKQFFSVWPEENEQQGLGESINNNNIAKYDPRDFDASTLHARSKEAKQTLADDGSGELKIWRAEKFKRIDVDKGKYGEFYDGDCYVLRYSYFQKTRQCHIVYFWQGIHSTPDEKGASAMFAQRADDDLGGSAVQVRVVQFKEPEHFLRIFKGKMIIFKGGIDSGFKKTKANGNAQINSDVRLFQMKGTSEINTRAVEVIARGSSLNSNDVFLLKSDSDVIVWEGEGASEDEIQFAHYTASHVAPDSKIEVVKEGKEKQSFWKLLGGKEEYAAMERLRSDTLVDYPPRLFQCSNASGRFTVEEILDFDQEDLCEDDVMLLDTYDEVFVWVGQGANFIEKKESLNAAMDYVKSDKSGRTVESTSILQVKQGFEPLNFTGYFLGWDHSKWSDGKSYEDIKKELGQENAGVSSAEKELEKFDKKYTYKQLLSKVTPDGVDPANKETHLSDDDFKSIFKLARERYDKLPKWRRTNLKKEVGLF